MATIPRQTARPGDAPNAVPGAKPAKPGTKPGARPARPEPGPARRIAKPADAAPGPAAGPTPSPSSGVRVDTPSGAPRNDPARLAKKIRELHEAAAVRFKQPDLVLSHDESVEAGRMWAFIFDRLGIVLSGDEMGWLAVTFSAVSIYGVRLFRMQVNSVREQQRVTPPSVVPQRPAAPAAPAAPSPIVMPAVNAAPRSPGGPINGLPIIPIDHGVANPGAHRKPADVIPPISTEEERQEML